MYVQSHIHVLIYILITRYIHTHVVTKSTAYTNKSTYIFIKRAERATVKSNFSVLAYFLGGKKKETMYMREKNKYIYKNNWPLNPITLLYDWLI